jgi:hypothetical protein
MNNFKDCIRCNVNKSFDGYYNDRSNKLHGKKNCCIECEKKEFSQNKVVDNKNIIQTYNISRRKKYEDFCKKIEDIGCKLLTTKDEYEDMPDFKLLNVKYESPCCNKIIEMSYTGFRHKKIKNKCYKCIMNDTDFKQKMSEKHSNRDNEFNVPHSTYQEYLGYLYIKELLEKNFIVKKNVHYTETDFIIKPKTTNNDEWLKIQLKTTGHIQRYQYKFSINNKNYDNHLLILLSIEDKEMWYFSGNISKDIKKISINKKTGIYKTNEINEDNIIEETTKYYNLLQKFTEENCNMIKHKHSLREYEFYKKRENLNLGLKFEYPEIEGTVYDLKINNYKIQDKVYGIVDNNKYRIYIQKRIRGKNISYDKGDNDFYWLWLDKSNYFFVIPESILIEHNFIKSPDDDKDKQYQQFLYIKPDENDKNIYWYNNYKYDITDTNIKQKLCNIFKIN